MCSHAEGKELAATGLAVEPPLRSEGLRARVDLGVVVRREDGGTLADAVTADRDVLFRGERHGADDR